MIKESSTIENLRLFSYRTQELQQLRLVRTGMEMKFSLHWDYVSKLLGYRMTKVDEEDLRSFLLTFRQFVSKNEPIFIERIFNDCERYLKNDKLKEQIRKAREEWAHTFHRMGPISMTINNKNLTGEYVLDLYINGHYFHNDSEKAEELRCLLGDFIPLFRVKFLEVISALTQIIIYLGGVISYALDQNLFTVRGSHS